MPDKLVLSGRSLEITMEGPSRECFITDPDGHIFICPPIGKYATLNVLPQVDLETVNAELLATLTEIEVDLRKEANAHYRPDGTCDPDFFNLDLIRREFADQHQVITLSINVQRPIAKASGSTSKRCVAAPCLDPAPSAEDFDLSKGDYATQLADIMARITRLHMHIAENVQGSADRHRVEERIHTVLDELQAVGDETLEMSSVSEQHQVNQLQQFSVDSRFVRDGAHPTVERGLPGIHSATSQGKRVSSTYAKQSFSHPLVGLSDAEHNFRIASLNTVTVEHFDTDENSRLLELELQSSSVLNPSGMHHVWIGGPGLAYCRL